MVARERQEEASPAEESAPPTRPQPTSPATVALGVQRTAGNAATARLVASQGIGGVLARDEPSAGVPRPPHIDVVPPRAGDPADMDRAIQEHFSNEEWDEAARILNGFDQAGIDTRVRGYDVGQRSFLANAASVNGAAADRIRKVAQLENAVFFSQWEDAARAIDGFPDQTRVEPRVRALAALELAFVLMHGERGALAVAPVARTVATARSAEMIPAFATAVSSSGWDPAAVLLNAMVDGDLTAQLAVPPRTPPELFDIDRRAIYWGINRVHDALGHDPQKGLIATEGLDRDLRTQMAASNWAGVTSTLEHYKDDDERRARLQWFHLPQRHALLESMRGGAVGVPASPIYPLVEARRVEKLGQEYAAAIAGSNFGYAVLLLNAYNDADLLPRANQIQTAKGAAGVAAATVQAKMLFPDDNHRVRRVLAYVPLQGQTSPAPAGGSMTKGAAAGPGVAVAAGP